MAVTPSASYSLTLRIQLENEPGTLGDVTSAIGEAGGSVGAIDIVKAEGGKLVRDITVDARSQEHWDQILAAVRDVEGVELLDVTDRTFNMHEGGKIEQLNKHPLKNRDDLSMAYTPGVARVCRAIHEDPELAFRYTIKRNYVAVVSDGSAVLGLGDIGPRAAMPVMEGKAMLLKEFGGVDAFPICLDTKDPDEIVATVKAIAPGFGGINLEDISSPRCFEIEDRLKAELDIPGLPRRPARDGRGRDGGAVQRAEDHRQAARGPARRDGRPRRGRDRGHAHAAPGRACARSSAATPTARSTSAATTGTRCTR